jgi:hypothetical protein
MKRFWHLLNSKSPLHDGIIWASESSIAAVGFTLVWVAMHAFLVRGIVTGKMGWYNLRFDPVFYWIQVISGSLCLIGIDLWFLYGVIQARKQMVQQAARRNAGRVLAFQTGSGALRPSFLNVRQ